MQLPLSNNSFVIQEFGNLNLGDQRLNKRAIEVAKMINKSPQLSFPNAAMGKKDELKAFYRFFQNEKVTDQRLLETHYSNTTLRSNEVKRPVLLVTDSVFMMPAKKNTMDGLKTKGTSENNNLRIHYMIAINASNGDVLGITDLRIIGKNLSNTNIKLNKECDIWSLVAKTTINRAKSILKNDFEEFKSKLIFIADREADGFHIFESLNSMGIDYIIRSAYKRRILNNDTGEISLFENLTDEEICHGNTQEIEIYSNGKKKKVKVRRSVLKNKEVLPPQRYTAQNPVKLPSYKSKKLSMVFVREVNPPRDSESLEWRVFTTLSVQNSKESSKIVDYYQKRWKIEELNKCAKTGVGLETRQFTKLEHLKPAISLIFVVAWRLLSIRDIADKDESVNLDLIFNEEELDYLKHKFKVPVSRLKLKKILLSIAEEGGYIGNCSRPGWLVLWRGWFQFTMQVQGFSFAKKTYGIK
jgi:hypothetical protein